MATRQTALRTRPARRSTAQLRGGSKQDVGADDGGFHVGRKGVGQLAADCQRGNHAEAVASCWTTDQAVAQGSITEQLGDFGQDFEVLLRTPPGTSAGRSARHGLFVGASKPMGWARGTRPPSVPSPDAAMGMATPCPRPVEPRRRGRTGCRCQGPAQAVQVLKQQATSSKHFLAGGINASRTLGCGRMDRETVSG